MGQHLLDDLVLVQAGRIIRRPVVHLLEGFLLRIAREDVEMRGLARGDAMVGELHDLGGAVRHVTDCGEQVAYATIALLVVEDLVSVVLVGGGGVLAISGESGRP